MNSSSPNRMVSGHDLDVERLDLARPPDRSSCRSLGRRRACGRAPRCWSPPGARPMGSDPGNLTPPGRPRQSGRRRGRLTLARGLPYSLPLMKGHAVQRSPPRSPPPPDSVSIVDQAPATAPGSATGRRPARPIRADRGRDRAAVAAAVAITLVALAPVIAVLIQRWGRVYVPVGRPGHLGPPGPGRLDLLLGHPAHRALQPVRLEPPRAHHVLPAGPVLGAGPPAGLGLPGRQRPAAGRWP